MKENYWKIIKNITSFFFKSGKFLRKRIWTTKGVWNKLPVFFQDAKCVKRYSSFRHPPAGHFGGLIEKDVCVIPKIAICSLCRPFYDIIIIPFSAPSSNLNPFSTNVPSTDKPGSYFLPSKHLKNNCGRVTL